MSHESAVVSILTGDSTLLSGLPGGVLAYLDQPSEGYTRHNTPAIYDSDGFRQAFGVVRGLDSVPAGYSSAEHGGVRQTIYVFLYADADSGFSSLETAANRIDTLLNKQAFTGGLRLLWRGNMPFREQDMNNAPAIRLEFDAYSIKE